MSSIPLPSSSRPLAPHESLNDAPSSDANRPSPGSPRVPVLTQRNVSHREENTETGSEICPIFMAQQTPANAKRMHEFMNDGPASLYNALQDNNLDRVNELLAGEGGKLLINHQFNKQGSALCIATKLGYEPIVRLLLKHGANVSEIVGKNGATPLIIAAKKGHTNIVSLLLKNGAGVDEIDDDFSTPLFVAAKKGHVKTVELLLNYDAELDGKNDNVTPLHVAAQEGHVDVVDMLLDEWTGADNADSQWRTALDIAVLAGREKVVELLLERMDDVNQLIQDEITPLFIAAAHGHFEVVKVFLKALEDQPEMREKLVNKTDRWGMTPLVIAAENGHENIVKKLKELTTSTSFESLRNIPFASQRELYSEGLFVLGPDTEKAEVAYLDKHVRQDAVDRKIPLSWFDEKTPERLWRRFDDPAPVLGAVGKFLGHGNFNPVENRHFFSTRKGEVLPTTELIEYVYRLGVRDMTFCGCEIRHAAERMMNRINLLWPKVDPALRITFIGGKDKILTSLSVQDVTFAFQDYAGNHLKEKEPGQESMLENMTVNGISVLTFDQATQKMTMTHHSPKRMDERSSLSAEQKKNVEQNWFLKRASTGKLDAIKEMFSTATSPIDVNYEGVTGITALCAAACSGHAELVEWLIENGATVDKRESDGGTPLQFAAQGGHQKIVKFLLNRGADINAVNHKGITPLYRAASSNHLIVMDLLLENGAEIEKCDCDGMTPLHAAVQNGHIDAVELLLENGADLNKADIDGMTPLHFAANEGNAEMVELLIVKGAGVNYRDNDNWTPLYNAAKEGHAEVVKLLLKHQAEIFGFGPSALGIAKRNGHTEIEQMMENVILDPKSREFL